MPQSNAAFLEDLRRIHVHAIRLTVYDLRDADLSDLDAAGQAGARVAVQNATLPDAFAACLQQRVFLGVKAEAGGQRRAAGHGGVAARATALVAVAHVAWRPVVAGADDAPLTHQHAPDTPLHAVAALRCERG